MLIIQFTGLSGSGKTTLALALKERLSKQNIEVEILDGDDCRKTICKDLGFSKEDRIENIRRLGAAANSLKHKRKIVIIAAINPFQSIREELKEKYNASIVWINCDLQSLIERDTKGLYKRALLPDGNQEKVYNLSGINAEYEEPENAELIISTDLQTVNQSITLLQQFVVDKLALQSIAS